jgi:acyl carrier protein
MQIPTTIRVSDEGAKSHLMSEEIQKEPNSENIRRFVLEKLAEIRVTKANVLEQQAVANGGDLDMDSVEGTAIASGLEGELGRSLVRPEDLDLKKFTSVKRLTDLLHSSLENPVKK